MGGTTMKYICLLLLSFSLLTSGCATMGTIAISSVFGLAGREGLNYFDSGSTEMILYKSVSDVEHAVENAFTNLTYKLERKQVWSNKTIRIIGAASDNKDISIQVSLRPIANRTTEIEFNWYSFLFLITYLRFECF